MTGNLNLDLDKTIVAAVNARIEGELLKAVSGDEVLAAMVASALQQPVKVSNDSYRNETEPYLTHILRATITKAAKAAVEKLIAEEIDSIEDAVRKALHRDIAKIASTLSQSVADVAARRYGVNVELTLNTPKY